MKAVFSYCLSFLMLSLTVSAQQVYETNRIHVKFKSNQAQQIQNFQNDQSVADPLQEIFVKYGVTNFVQLAPNISNLQSYWSLEFSDGAQIEALITELNALDKVEIAEMIPMPRVASALAVPGEMNPDLMWYIDQIKMPDDYWDLRSSLKIKIAIVDNGVRLTHEDIKDNLWTNLGEIPGNGIDDDKNGYIDDIHGYDVADNDNDPSPPSKADNNYFTHGTHVAGIASASSSNAVGTVSIGLNAEIMAVKCAKSDQQDDLAFPFAYEGIQYAADAGADIINLSWTHIASNSYQRDVIEYAIARGCILIAAAGNAGSGSFTVFPASFPGVIAVGATDADDFITDYSNYGDYIDVMAPGNNIYSTLAGSDKAYGSFSGTSQATPIVSALVSLMLSQYPEKKALIEEALKKSCDDISINNWDIKDKIGAGRINVSKALSELSGANSNSPYQPKVIHLMVYPNPASTHFNLPSTIQATEVVLFDMSGRQVGTLPVQNGRVEVGQLGLKGLFLVRTITEQGVATAKIQLR